MNILPNVTPPDTNNNTPPNPPIGQPGKDEFNSLQGITRSLSDTSLQKKLDERAVEVPERPQSLTQEDTETESTETQSSSTEKVRRPGIEQCKDIHNAVNDPRVDTTYGALMLNSGMLSSLRFYGPKDTPLAKVVEALWPSTGGGLSNRVNNYGRLAYHFSIQDAAHCLNYLSGKSDSLELDLIKKIETEQNDLNEKLTKLKSSQKHIQQTINNLNKNKKGTEGLIKKFKEEGKSTKQLQEKLDKTLSSLLEPTEKLNKVKEQAKLFSENIKQCTQALNSPEINDFSENLMALKGMESQEKYIAIQTLLAFVYDRNSTAQGAQKFLLALDSSLLLKEDEVPGKVATDVLDYYKELYNKPPTSYVTNPITNGLTHLCDKDGKELTGTFADCVEVSIRHIFNILFFDNKTGEFNLSAVNGDNERTKRLKAFFEGPQSNPNLSNDGSTPLRTDWNKVVSFIDGVVYQNDGNNIKPGFQSIYNAMAALIKPSEPFDEKQPSEPFDEKQPAKSFQKLFQLCCPGKKIEVRANLDSENPDIGNLKITVTTQDLSEKSKTFDFSLNVSSGHASIKAGENFIPETSVLQLDTDVPLTGIEQSAHLLSKDLKPKDGYYYVYQNDASDNISKIDMLTRCLEVKDQDGISKDQDGISKHQDNIVALINTIQWNDGGVRNYLKNNKFDVFKDLANTLDETHRAQIKCFVGPGFEKFQNVETLFIDKNSDITTLDLSKLENLKTLDVWSCASLATLQGLNKCTNLESVMLYDLTALTALDLPQTDKLKTLKVSNCESLETLTGLNKCTNLESVMLYDLTALTALDLPQTDKLKTLKVSNCESLETLTGLNKCTNLESVMLYDLTALTALDLPQTDKLKTLKVSNCESLETLTGLNKCTNLESVMLYDLTALTALDLPQTDKLKTLNVEDCKSLARLTGLENCTNLESVTLDNLDALTALDLPQSDKLKTLYVEDCKSLAKLPGLDYYRYKKGVKIIVSRKFL